MDKCNHFYDRIFLLKLKCIHNENQICGSLAFYVICFQRVIFTFSKFVWFFWLAKSVKPKCIIKPLNEFKFQSFSSFKKANSLNKAKLLKVSFCVCTFFNLPYFLQELAKPMFFGIQTKLCIMKETLGARCLRLCDDCMP